MAVRSRELFPGHSVASTNDLEQARRILSEVFLPLDFSAAQALTALPMLLNVVKLGGSTLGYLKFRDVVSLRTAVGTNYHVVIPMSGSAVLRFPSRPPFHATTTTAGVFGPQSQAWLELDADFSQLSLVFPHESLEFELEAMLGSELDRPIEFARDMELDAPRSEPFIGSLRLIDAVSRSDSAALVHRRSALRLEQVLTHSLLFGQPSNYSALLQRAALASGPRAVRIAVDRMRADPAHPWTVAELASASSVSTRSLQEGFRRSIQTTPMRYLRRVRLERVYEDLAAAEPDTTTVSEVASGWGFSHLGHFGDYYRRRFGERPSETLRRSGRRD